MFSKRTADQFKFCRAGERRSMFESVVTDGFDRVKHGQSAPAEQFDVDPQIRRDRSSEGETSFKQFARSLNEDPH